MSSQLQTRWDEALNGLRRLFHPGHERILGVDLPHYYWSAEETEWATDVLFHSRKDLAAIYPQLVRHGITTFGSGDVLRFFGRRPCVQQFRTASIDSDQKTRPEGIRIKHRFGHNSIKMYDKQETVLRIETTIDDARAIKQQSAKVTRCLRLLRGHKLISKIAGTHRYRLTKSGRIQVTAILTAQNASTAKLTELAA